LRKLLSLDPPLLKKLQQLDKSERIECLLALVELTEAFGQPHRHGGLAFVNWVTAFSSGRGSLTLPFLFANRPEDLFVFFLEVTPKSKNSFATGSNRSLQPLGRVQSGGRDPSPARSLYLSIQPRQIIGRSRCLQ